MPLNDNLPSGNIIMVAIDTNSHIDTETPESPISAEDMNDYEIKEAMIDYSTNAYEEEGNDIEGKQPDLPAMNTMDSELMYKRRAGSRINAHEITNDGSTTKDVGTESDRGTLRTSDGNTKM